MANEENNKQEHPTGDAGPLPDSNTVNLRDFYLRRDAGRPAKDCWILIPEQGITLDAGTQEIWLEKARMFRRVRGDFLVAGFEIEYCVDLLIREVLFPSVAIGPDEGKTKAENSKAIRYSDLAGHSFQQHFLRSAENLFARKVKMLEELASDFPSLGGALPKDIFKRLRKIMDIRNVFAHYPIVFILLGTPPTQQVGALLVRESAPIELNKEFFEKHSLLFCEVNKDLEAALQRFRDNPLGVEPQELGKQLRTRMFLGHAQLNMDEWLGLRDVPQDEGEHSQ